MVAVAVYEEYLVRCHLSLVGRRLYSLALFPPRAAQPRTHAQNARDMERSHRHEGGCYSNKRRMQR